MFSTLSQTGFAILATFELFSANALNFDKSNILLFGKELNITCFSNYVFEVIKKLGNFLRSYKIPLVVTLVLVYKYSFVTLHRTV